MTTTTRRGSVRRLAGLALLAAALIGQVACSKSPVAFQGIDITGAEYARQLKLTDVDGKQRTLDEFKGKVVVVFFGYTQCPDVCPTTLAELAAVKKKLGADGDKVVGMFVSVDPERDTAPVLKAYVNSFGNDFVALRGSVDEVKEVAREFKVFFAKVPGTTDGSYTIDHTAVSYVFDPQGRVRLAERYGTSTDALQQDLKALIDGA